MTRSELMQGNFIENLRQTLDCNVIFVTLSEDGIIYVNAEKKSHIPAFPRNIADVCGAGDTVIATISMAFLSGYRMDTIGLMANVAGGQVCEQTGVAPIKIKPLAEEFQRRLKETE